MAGMALVWRLAALGAVVALAFRDLNTQSEIQKAQEVFNRANAKQVVRRHDRIYSKDNVTPPPIGRFPSVVLTVFKTKEQVEVCTGVIMSRWYVLGMHSCVPDNMIEGMVFAGDVDYVSNNTFDKINVQIRTISNVVVSPNPPSELAMFKLHRPLEIVKGYVQIEPLTNKTKYYIKINRTCSVVGFANKADRPDVMKYGLMTENRFRVTSGIHCDSDLTWRYLCTKDVATKSACNADRGGRLFCGRVMLGIIQGAIYEDPAVNYCGAPVKYNLYIAVGFYRQWIKELLEGAPTPAVKPFKRSLAPRAWPGGGFTVLYLLSWSANLLLVH